jgi:ornithine cyclodeaminase/alanine dehydrogenase
MLFDRNNGLPLGVINAEHMTGMRTGAAGAIGAKYMARKDSKVMLMVGAGHQASYQIRAMQCVFGDLEKVMVYDPINFEGAQKFVDDFKYKLDKVEYISVKDLETATKEADIIVTATPSREAMIMKEWVKKGTHFSCIGSDMEGKQEIDEGILKISKLVCDDITQSVNVGEFEIGIKKEIIKKSDIMCEIGDILVGKCNCRTCDEDITVYDSTGIGLQDIAVGFMAINKAKENELNRFAEF